MSYILWQVKVRVKLWCLNMFIPVRVLAGATLVQIRRVSILVNQVNSCPNYSISLMYLHSTFKNIADLTNRKINYKFVLKLSFVTSQGSLLYSHDYSIVDFHCHKPWFMVYIWYIAMFPQLTTHPNTKYNELEN